MLEDTNSLDAPQILYIQLFVNVSLIELYPYNHMEKMLE